MSCDLPDFSREQWATCNGKGKLRRCCECCGRILPGDRYLTVSGKWDGEFQSYRWHELCNEICEAQRGAFSAAGRSWDEMPPFGHLVEEAREDADEGDAVPDYWPAGVWISTGALRDHVREQADRFNLERVLSPRAIATEALEHLERNMEMAACPAIASAN